MLQKASYMFFFFKKETKQSKTTTKKRKKSQWAGVEPETFDVKRVDVSKEQRIMHCATQPNCYDHELN